MSNPAPGASPLAVLLMIIILFGVAGLAANSLSHPAAALSVAAQTGAGEADDGH